MSIQHNHVTNSKYAKENYPITEKVITKTYSSLMPASKIYLKINNIIMNMKIHRITQEFKYLSLM